MTQERLHNVAQAVEKLQSHKQIAQRSNPPSIPIRKGCQQKQNDRHRRHPNQPRPEFHIHPRKPLKMCPDGEHGGIEVRQKVMRGLIPNMQSKRQAQQQPRQPKIIPGSVFSLWAHIAIWYTGRRPSASLRFGGRRCSSRVCILGLVNGVQRLNVKSFVVRISRDGIYLHSFHQQNAHANVRLFIRWQPHLII